MTQQANSQIEHLRVRSYSPNDLQEVMRLYDHGLLTGQIAPNDTGADIDNMAEAYFSNPRDHFWVAEMTQGEDKTIVGMIGVANDRHDTAEVRRLRVDKQYQQTEVAAKLLETALQHCQHHNYLKVILDTRFDPDAAHDLFHRFGFQHNRTRSIQGKDLLEFYLDIYRHPKQDGE